jgi:uncharacterized protein (DUF1778 family)
MKSNTKIPQKKTVKSNPSKLIRFESQEQIDLIQNAARRRGLSFTAFVRLASVGMAHRVLEAPAEELLGKFFPSVEKNLTL